MMFEMLNNQILKMQWLSDLVALLIENIFHISLKSQLGSALHFFIYDTLKVFILMTVLIYCISYIQSYFPPERTSKILRHMNGIKGNIFGALLGTVTPFCSCSSIPIFIGFTNSGLPLGVTFSFLISSPLVDLASFLMLASFFGFSFAFIYVFVGLVLAIVGGIIINHLHLENEVEAFVRQTPISELEIAELSPKLRHKFAINEVKLILKKVWVYIFIGVGVGALIHNWIPTSFIHMILGSDNPFSVIIATLFGIPIYADIFGTLPIAEALYMQDVQAGTIVSLMMAVTALSLPSFIMLSKVIKIKLLVVFISIVTIGIIIFGYLLNSIMMFL